MPKITAIKKLQGRQDRFAVYIDDNYEFSMSQMEIYDQKIKLHQQLSPADYSHLKQLAVQDKAYDRALGLIARRPRSEWEIRFYLKQKDYSEDTIEKTIQKLINKNFINDKNFAQAWVTNRRLLKSTSKRRLEQELKQKRIATDIIHDVLEADDTDESTVLKDVINRKRQQSRYQDDQKLMQYLIRQGYNYSDIKTALKELSE